MDLPDCTIPGMDQLVSCNVLPGITAGMGVIYARTMGASAINTIILPHWLEVTMDHSTHTEHRS